MAFTSHISNITLFYHALLNYVVSSLLNLPRPAELVCQNRTTASPYSAMIISFIKAICINVVMIVTMYSGPSFERPSSERPPLISKQTTLHINSPLVKDHL